MKTGDEYFDSQEFQELLTSYEEAVSSGQPVFMDAEELAEIADYYQMTNHQDQAEEAINLALSLAPGAIAPLTYKVHESLYYNRIDDAEHYFNQITETDAPDYIYDQAEILIAKGKVQEADDLLHEQLNNVPNHERQDYIIDVAGIFQDYCIFDKAMDWMKMAEKEDTPQYKELLARTLFGLGQYKDSEKLFNELIDTNPFSTQYWNALASTQMMNRDFSSAIQSSEYAIAIDPDDPDALLSKANGLFELDNYEEALQYFERFNKIDPTDEVAHLRQGTCLINLRRIPEAIQVLSKALEMTHSVSPYMVDIYRELAFAYGANEEPEKALECLDKTDQMECDHADIEVIKGHILLANNRLEEAEGHFRQAIVTTDDPRRIFLRVIVSLYDNRFLDATYNMLKKYFQVYGEDASEGYAYMAICCYEMKHNEEFLHYLKKACETDPKECKLVLSSIFPDDIAPENYYEYITNQMKS